MDQSVGYSQALLQLIDAVALRFDQRALQQDHGLGLRQGLLELSELSGAPYR